MKQDGYNPRDFRNNNIRVAMGLEDAEEAEDGSRKSSSLPPWMRVRGVVSDDYGIKRPRITK